MFAAIGALSVRRHRYILVLAGLLFVLLTAVGVTAFSALESGGQTDPGAPSSQAETLVADHFGGEQGLVLLVTAKTGTARTPAVTAVATAVTQALEHDPDISNISSYATTPSPALLSRDGRSGLILAHVKGNDNQVNTRTKALLPRLTALDTGAATLRAGGVSAASSQTTSQVGKDLLLVSVIAVPLTVALLYLAFGSFLAALLPLAAGGLTIMGTFAVLKAVSLFTDVSSYSVDLTIALGLGLAVDYSLLLINRYREEKTAGWPHEAAVARATEIAGKTIAFSGLTVGAALTSLLLFPLYFLRSFAYAGIAVVILAVVSALFLMPALLTVFGSRTDPRKARKSSEQAAVESPFWRRLATTVTRRPLVAALPVVALLLFVGSPLLGVHFSTPDDRVLPTSASAHQVGDVLRTGFATDASSALTVVSTGPATKQQQGEYAANLSRVSGVSAVQGPTGTYAAGRQTAPPGHQTQSEGDVSYWQVSDALPFTAAPAQALVRHIRAISGPGGQPTLVGGSAADLTDQKHAVAHELPYAVAIILLATFIVLFLFTGSVLIPLKAVVLNGLTLFAVLGAMVWVFQDGHFTGLLNFTPTPTSTTIPPLVFVIAFGLSMDYEVFLISRIKELHDEGMPNTEAIVGGLSRASRIVSTAAALLCVTFFAFGLSKISFIQFFGIGTGIAVLLDSTLTRGVLVPAVMRLAGEHIWWAPAPLRRLHNRIGITEAASAAAPGSGEQSTEHLPVG